MAIRRIGVITSGGDCGGLNAVIKGVARMSLAIGAETVFIPNGYAKIVPVSSAESAIVADRVERKLKEFLHPITGRKERTGWEFGQDVFISEIAAEIEDVEAINYITELTLKKKDKFLQEASIGRNMLITIEDNELPSAGNIKVSSEKVINAAAITGFGQ